ncbi:acyltransferase [Hymenobacter ginsengisoli]|uniref:Acyltransferase n=1 Tax=Hymenobacter ginsengisoli TaxID=1051626 RepID=A0ABP8QLI8_9BACT|nr:MULTISPECIES: acyltransferase [unclassified Hymenobacter]MBO2033386.1 acyltransferase [Hymenobacter sp. BT559]
MPSSTLARPITTAYYPALTGIRALGAFLVFFVHFRPLGTPELADRIATAFYITLSMFFVLSGFAIAHRYQQSVRFTKSWWWAYFWQRAARIYPTYLLLNTAALARVYWPIPAGKLVNSLILIFLSETMLRGFSNTLKYVGVPPGWSLTPEECFYVSLPFLLLLWQRRGILGAVGFALAMLSIGLLLTAVCQGRPALHGFFGTYHHLFNFTFFGRVFEFVLGVGLARWWGGRPSGEASGWPWRTLSGALAVALTVAILAYIDSPQTPYDGNLYPSTIILNIVVFPISMTLLLAGLLAERTWFRTWLATPFMDEAGKRSYSFYLLHVGLFSVWWHDTFGWGRHIFLQLLATALLAELCYRFFERPVHRWLLARTVGRSSTTTQPLTQRPGRV